MTDPGKGNPSKDFRPTNMEGKWGQGCRRVKRMEQLYLCQPLQLLCTPNSLQEAEVEAHIQTVLNTELGRVENSQLLLPTLSPAPDPCPPPTLLPTISSLISKR